MPDGSVGRAEGVHYHGGNAPSSNGNDGSDWPAGNLALLLGLLSECPRTLEAGTSVPLATQKRTKPSMIHSEGTGGQSSAGGPSL